jgi:hypothetical protein
MNCVTVVTMPIAQVKRTRMKRPGHYVSVFMRYVYEGERGVYMGEVAEA